MAPKELLALAEAQGYTAGTKPMVIVEWLKTDYGLGRGHAMSLVYVIKNGAQISEKHVGRDGVHRDESTTLYLDGVAHRAAEGAGGTAV